MEDFLKKYYSGIKDYLLKASLTDDIEDLDIISFKVHRLESELEHELDKKRPSDKYVFDGEDAITGLFTKYERFYGEKASFIDRNPDSQLAIRLDCGFRDYSPPCPYSFEEFPNIQRNITDYINKREKTTEYKNSKPLLTGVVKTKISLEQQMFIVDNLISVSHHITDFIDYYDNDNWNWQVDCIFIAQYVFEKAAELTYFVAKGKDTDEISYDIKEAFSYFQTLLTEELQEKIDGAVVELDDIIIDINYFINNKQYDLCDKETWFRTIIFNIALMGMHFILEQEL